MAAIASIVYKPKKAPKSPDHYVRLPLTSTQLLVDYGIEGDAKGGNPVRQLNIMCAETMQQLATEGYMTAPGELGEQLAISGLDIDLLPPGTQLRLGDSAIIELIKPRTGCERFEAIQHKKAADVQKRMGMIARVLHSGPIQTGDPVVVLETVHGNSV